MSNVEGQIALKNQQAAYNKAAYDQGLADEAVRRNEAYANEHLGYGLTRRDLANFMGAPVNSVRLDQFSDGELQALGQQKQIQQAKDQAAIQDMIAKNREYNQAKKIQAANMAKPMDMVDYAQTMYSPEASQIAAYEKTVDPGLAAKWMSSYKGQ